MTPDGDQPHAAAGWYPDPDGSGGHRYWDGHTWTGYRAAAPAPPRPALDDGRRTLLVRYLVLCLGLLALVRRGKGALAGSLLVWGLALLVGSLAWGNGEPAHVNVINFVLVTLLASVVGSRREVLLLGALSALEMGVIAWQRPLMPPGKDLAEARFESLVQILPTFLVVVAILWLRAGMAGSRAGGGADVAGVDPRP